MLIAEQMIMLCIDPRTGVFDSPTQPVDINRLVAGALLLDLSEHHRLRYNANHVAIQSNLPITHPQLSAAARVLSSAEHGLPIGAAIDLLVSRLAPISVQLLDRLYRRDVLHRTRKSWWPWSEPLYPVRSIQARNEAIDQLNNGAASKNSTLRGLGLLILTSAAGQLVGNLSGNTHEIATLKLMELVNDPIGEDPTHEFLAKLQQSLN